VESQLRRVCAGRHKVSSAKGRQKVVQRRFVGEVYDREIEAPLVAVTVEQIVVPYADIE